MLHINAIWWDIIFVQFPSRVVGLCMVVLSFGCSLNFISVTDGGALCFLLDAIAARSDVSLMRLRRD